MMDVILSADRWLFIALNASLHWAPIDAVMMMMSEVKHFHLLVGIFLAVLIWKGGSKGRATALLLMLSILISDQLAAFVLKPIFQRARPCHEIINAVALGGCGGGLSFPSSHAFNIFAFMTVLAASFPRYRKWFYTFAGLIAYSRIHVGAHYPLDVICGAALGYGVGRLLVLSWRVLEQHAIPLLTWIADWYHAFRRLGEWMRGRKYALPILSGVLLGIAFPSVQTGITASFGLIPLLFAIEKMERRHWWQYFKIYYVCFFVFHAIANYWIGGWMAEADPFLEIACVVLMFVHPFFLMVPMVVYAWLRRRLGLRSALMALPFVWTAFEYLHSIGDLGYPWLTLGNSQTYYTAGIQFADITGVYGISFVLLVQNVALFMLLRQWIAPVDVARHTKSLVAVLVCTIVVPALYGEWTFRDHDLNCVPEKTFRVAVIQPNIDPWGKWTTVDQMQQVAQLEILSRSALARNPDMLLWPETAIPFFITLPNNAMALQEVHRFVNACGMPLLTGIPDQVYYGAREPHPADAQKLNNGEFTAGFNSSTVFTPWSEALPIYHKRQLVPFGERTPFVDEVPMFADIIKWSVGLSGWSKGTDSTVFTATHGANTAKIYSMICYESVYPSLVREFVKRGATMMTVITNDGWYGRTAGPVQHQQYAVLRAIENRRAIARCANTGISCFIDRYGNVDQRTALYETAVIFGDCVLNDAVSIYTEYGDLLAWVCCGVAGLVIVAAIVVKKSFT